MTAGVSDDPLSEAVIVERIAYLMEQWAKAGATPALANAVASSIFNLCLGYRVGKSPRRAPPSPAEELLLSALAETNPHLAEVYVARANLARRRAGLRKAL